MTQRSKTPFRHIQSDGQKVKVTQDGDQFFIGNTNERAEGKMVHHRNIVDGKLPKYSSSYEEGDEWSDYAHTSEDL